MGEVILCIGILFGKAIENVSYTLRTVLATRNLKFWVTLLGIINNTIGIILTATIVVGIKDSPDRLICYALGETLGAFLGMLLDRKMALGSNVMTIIVNKSIMGNIIKKLSDNNFKVTYLIGKGLKEDRAVIKTYVERKNEKEVRNLLIEEQAHAVIFESKVLSINNG